MKINGSERLGEIIDMANCYISNIVKYVSTNSAAIIVKWNMQ